MIARSLATPRLRHRVVGVITSPAELDFAIRMRKPPDFFELRLDRLVRVVDRLENKISKLRAPLIITARHPSEGGANRLSLPQRHNLLARFLSRARYIDVELRSVPAFQSLLRLARKQNVRRIISVHCLKSTPTPKQLRAQSARGEDVWRGYFQAGDTHRHSGATDAIDRFRRGKGP